MCNCACCVPKFNVALILFLFWSVFIIHSRLFLISDPFIFNKFKSKKLTFWYNLYIQQYNVGACCILYTTSKLHVVSLICMCLCALIISQSNLSFWVNFNVYSHQ